MHARKSQPHLKDKPRQLQRRLYLAAKRSRNRRFHALYDRLVRFDVLWRAWEEVRANGGSAGVDGVGIEDVERRGVQGFLDELAADLKARRDSPEAGTAGRHSEAGRSEAAVGHPDGARSGGPGGMQARGGAGV